MTHLLDTNAWILVLRGHDLNLKVHMAQTIDSHLALCSVVLSELWYGAMHSPPTHRSKNKSLVRRLQRTYTSLPFNDVAAEQCGRIRAHLAKLGTPIGPNDLMIASIALTNGLTLVTQNPPNSGASRAC